MERSAASAATPNMKRKSQVYISAFLHPERSIFQIVQQAAEHRYRLLISLAIVNEVGRVLREHFSLEERVTIRRLKRVVI